jgi:hypothetical protein
MTHTITGHGSVGRRTSMPNKIFHVRVRLFPRWFRAAIAILMLVAFYGFIWSLVKPRQHDLAAPLILHPASTAATR